MRRYIKDGTSYTFTLQVTNFLLQRGVAEVAVTKSAAVLPSVTVVGVSASSDAPLTFAYGADVRLTAEAVPAGRGLHSSTFQLNLSRF